MNNDNIQYSFLQYFKKRRNDILATSQQHPLRPQLLRWRKMRLKNTSEQIQKRERKELEKGLEEDYILSYYGALVSCIL